MFKHNANAKYTIKYLKGGYNNNNFSLLNVYLDEKGTSVKIQLPNIIKDHHITAKLKATIARDELSLFLALWRKFYNSHRKCRAELNEHFHIYRCQLNFVMFAATSTLGISWQHLIHPNVLVRSFYSVHVQYSVQVRLILHELGIFLPYEDGFSKVKNAYIKGAYYSICDDHGVDANETWMHGDWFYTTDCVVFVHDVKATERSPPDNLTQWIVTQSKGFIKAGIEKISRSVVAYVYLVLSSQIKARSTMASNSAPALDAQKVFKDTFNDLIRGYLSIDPKKYQGVLEHALSKVDFSVGVGVYMLPRNLDLNIWRKEGYNNKILVSNKDMKIGSNMDINRDRKKFVPPEVPKAVISADRHEPVEITIPHSLKMLTKNHNDKKYPLHF